MLDADGVVIAVGSSIACPYEGYGIPNGTLLAYDIIGYYKGFVDNPGGGLPNGLQWGKWELYPTYWVIIPVW